MTKKIIMSILSMSIILTLSVAAFASEIPYVGYKLGRFKQNNHTGYHEKATNDDYIKNVVENLSKTSTASFWADDSSGKISKKYNQKVSSTAKIKFNTNKDKGNDIRMTMENASFSVNDAFVAGRVDFR